MGYYAEYLDAAMSFEELAAERKKQLSTISSLRTNRDVLVFAADLNKGIPEVAIGYADLLPISDQLSNLSGKAVDLILGTPGGSGEVAEDIVRLLHEKYDDVAVIVPGYAKSAGTIIAMAGDEILMGASSALGPIDAQIQWQGKSFSADAPIEGLEKIKREVQDTGVLNRAYIPMLQGISPGEIQNAENALNFAKVLVTQWLAKYKFKNWNKHSNATDVAPEERTTRAEEIAAELCDHRKWLTHGRSLKIDDLEGMRLRITDYRQQAALEEAITRYHTLLQMTFSSNLYKLFETPTSQIVRFTAAQVPAPQPFAGAPEANLAVIEIACASCGQALRVQANLGSEQPLQEGCLPYPAGDRLPCPNCAAELDLTEAKRQLEAQAKRPVVPKEG